jgi:4-amino-4-deoxy-L-arabinose transferase-like glycosyltransferase
MHKIKKQEIIVIIAASLLIMLPFINQAYYIDDFIYLSAAQQYNEYGFDSFKNGMSDQEGYLFPNYYLTHPLLWPWLLAMFIKTFNTTNEVALHSISIITIIITGFSALLISKRFTKEPLLSTLFFLFLPAVMLLSHVVMTDIPTLAFFLLAMGFYFEGLEKNSVWYLLFAAIAATISIGISYQALFIIFLFCFYNFLRKKKNLRAFIPIIIPLIFFTGWCLYTWRALGIPHPFISFQWGYVSATRNILNDFFSKFSANINSIGAATFFPIFILVVYSLRSNCRKLLAFSLFTAVLFVFLLAYNYSIVQKILFITYFTAGLFIILRIVMIFIHSFKTKDKDNIFVTIWFISFFVSVVFTMPMGVSRYLIPVFLPVVIVILNDIRNFFTLEKFKKVVIIGLGVTALWGYLCSIADYTFAGLYREFTEEISNKYKEQNIWYCGDGFSFYMKAKGNKPVLFEGEKPKINDIVVITSELWSYKVPDVMKRAVLIKKISYNSIYPIRTMNMPSHAGFHDNLSGALLPFSITRSRYEEFSIYKIVKD